MVTFKQSTGALNPLPGEVVAQANDLYWHSGAGVNRLAREMDLSKGALYEIIAPLPAGLPCPRGDGELSYPNRTARERGFVSCATCGLEDDEERVRANLDDAGAALEPLVPAGKRDATLEGVATGPAGTAAPPARNLERLLAATALAGIAAGLILSALVRRR